MHVGRKIHINSQRHRLFSSLFLCVSLFLCSCIQREVVIERSLQHDIKEHGDLRLAIELAGFKVVNRVRASGQQWLVAASSYVDDYSTRYYNVAFVSEDVKRLDDTLPVMKTLRFGKVSVDLLNEIVTDENCDIDRMMIAEHEEGAMKWRREIQVNLRLVKERPVQ